MSKKKSGKKNKASQTKKPTPAPASKPAKGLDRLISDPKATLGILIAVCVIAAIAITAIIIGAVNSAGHAKKAEFTPPPFEENAVVGVPEVDEALGWSELAVRDGYVVHVCGMLNSYDGETVAVWFTSDANNDVWLKLRMRDTEGTILGQTGILRPGEYVEYMTLNESAHTGDVILEIMGYEPETYYSAGTVGLSTTLTLPQ